MNTIWDKIYRNYQKGGPAWGSLSEQIMPQFVDFVEHANFSTKSAFDIGVGTGDYLQYLSERGFKIGGLDNSETATAMAKEKLEKNATIVLANAFDYEIPKGKYDFIFSISTIHHGFRSQISNLVANISKSIIQGGSIFITLPSIEARNSWKSFKNSKELAPGTFSPITGPEKGLPHSFYSRTEIKRLFIGFKDISIEKDDRERWIITGHI